MASALVSFRIQLYFAMHRGLSCSSTEPIVFFPAIYITNFFKFVLLGQRHFIESVFYLTHGVKTRLNGIMHLLRRTLPPRSQPRFDAFVSPTSLHHFSLNAISV